MTRSSMLEWTAAPRRQRTEGECRPRPARGFRLVGGTALPIPATTGTVEAADAVRRMLSFG